MRILFMGTPEFAKKNLEALYNNGENIIGVVTSPDKPKGRGMVLTPSDVKKFAVEKNLPIFQPTTLKDGAFLDTLKELNPDLIVVVAYGKILPSYVLDYPKYGCINNHASILPKYRGAAPIQRAIINGDTKTGICTMITELGLDCGDICMTHPIEITPNMNCVELFEICATESPQLLEKTLLGLVDGTVTPTKQCEDGVCFADKLQKEECLIRVTEISKANKKAGY